MGRKLRRILMEEWDPISVRGIPEAADEYDGYLGPLAARLREGRSAEAVAEYLTEIEEDRMGLGESAAARERNRRRLLGCSRGYDQEMTAGAE